MRIMRIKQTGSRHWSLEEGSSLLCKMFEYDYHGEAKSIIASMDVFIPVGYA
jgi:hypothetical protein